MLSEFALFLSVAELVWLLVVANLTTITAFLPWFASEWNMLPPIFWQQQVKFNIIEICDKGKEKKL